MEHEGTIQEGNVLNVPHLEKAGLKATKLYVRSNVIRLWQVLKTSSCVVQGPPGIGKSTSVWYWLLSKVSEITSDRSSLWCHFRASGAPSTYLVIAIDDDQDLRFKPVKRPNLSKEEKFAVCVIDGVRQENKGKVNEICEELEYDQMVWVTSQQIVIHEEILEELAWEEFFCSSWTRREIDSYVAVMSKEGKAVILEDFHQAMAARIDDRDYSVDEVIDIKYWFFGGSARYMFGMKMARALVDIEKAVHKINDVEQVFRGLTGSLGPLAVDHIISHFPDVDLKFGLLSSHVIELLSTKVGFAAITMLYRTTWVQENPSVHGFVFEWDLFTQIKQYKKLALSSTKAGDIDTTWNVDHNISLKTFLAGTNMTACIMVRPEKWNHPEYDGLYIHTNDQGERELVAWNASEAAKHNGSVTKLLLLLQEIGNRPPTAHPIVVDKVRFVFITPTENFERFERPNDSAHLLAKNQLAAWRFPGYEVFGGHRTMMQLLL